MDGGTVIMAKITLKDGLIYADATLSHGNKKVIIKNALVDTGSASTVISNEIANKLGLKPEPTDLINSVQGVGGSETVIEKKIDSACLDTASISDFRIQVGAMDYGIELEAIIGLDMLTGCRVVLDLNNFILKTA
jgi:predicted aspartyl protease